MTITSADIYLFKSQVIADTPDGGGLMTGAELVDGELNNLFDDTSRLDRVNGRVSLRKAFGAVQTNTRDKFLGAHAIISRPPADGRVVGTILELNSHTDRRSDAKAFVEQYVLASAETQMTLYSSQPQGAKTVIAYQNTSDPLPSISDVICLSVESAASPFFGAQQFLRIKSLSVTTVKGSDSQGEYPKNVLTMEVSDALSVPFPGNDLARMVGSSSKPTRVRKTDLNPGAKFYGTVPVTSPVGQGTTLLKCQSILQSVVPAGYSETPLLDRQIGGSGAALVDIGPSYTVQDNYEVANSSISVTLPRAARAGSVAVDVRYSGDATYNAVLTETGNGILTRQSGGTSSINLGGSVNSSTGVVQITGFPTSNGAIFTIAVTYTPAVAVADVQFSAGTLITLGNRGFNYNKTLLPKPAPGTVRAQFRALGVWYSLTDNGAGQLTAAPGIGAGTINYATGTVNLTSGYQPDVGSQVLFGWGSGANFRPALTLPDAPGDSPSNATIGINGVISLGEGIVPGSLDISYSVAGGTYRIVDGNSDGVLTGDGAGSIVYSTGELVFAPAITVPNGTLFTIAASKGARQTSYSNGSTANGNLTFTLQNAPALANTVSIIASYAIAGGVGRVNVVFQSSGNTFKIKNASSATGVRSPNATYGSIDHATGACSLPTTIVGGFVRQTYDAASGIWSNETLNLTASLSLVGVSYSTAASTSALATTVTGTSYKIDLSKKAHNGFVSGSLLFSFKGRAYYDRAGQLFYRLNNSEVVAGSFDAESGLVTVNDYAASPAGFSLMGLLTQNSRKKLTSVVWRTDGAPLRSQSFQVTDGVSTAAAGVDGTLNAPGFVTGSINIDTGVYALNFPGTPTPVITYSERPRYYGGGGAGGVAQFGYSPTYHVQVTYNYSGTPANQLRYNAVALTYLPIDPAILGINAVRLPIDGRVPVIRPGDDLVVLNDKTDALPNPVAAGQTYPLSRDRLALAVVTDSNGLKVPIERYALDLDLGSITFATPLNLSGFVQPLRVEHRIEDMVLCTDAQLNGDVQISGDISHNFPAVGTYVASAKLIGDLQSRASAPISQQAWTGAWSDVLLGSPSAAQYNNVTSPIAVRNDGAIVERWRIEFVNANQFRLIGETVGQIDTGSTLAEFAPKNPATGEPYFTIPAAGWGAGWVAGNQLRFNTFAAAAPLWVLRCTLQGPATEPDDAIRIEFRGDH